MKTSAYEDYDETVVVGGEEQLRKGPWTEEEDTVLANYISAHGEGHWNTLARSAGLRRTGKSCRLRWLNYLRPDVRRGNISLQEQLLILQLHSRWGNRWSKIAQELPGRTDNEIKNYWRTRVQKQAKQLRCDVNSQQFRDTMRYVWMPRLVERIQAASAAPYSAETTQTAPEPNSSETSSWETQVSPVSDLTECSGGPAGNEPCLDGVVRWQEMEEGVMSSWDSMVWSEENVWFLQQQLSD